MQLGYMVLSHIDPSGLPLLVLSGVAVLLVLLCFGIPALLRHRRHDRALKREAETELTPPPPSALVAPVAVIPEEALPRPREGVFMPIPASAMLVEDLVCEKRDGVRVRGFIRLEDADKYLSDAAAEHLIARLPATAPVGGTAATVYTDILGETFSAGSYVDLAILKKLGLVPPTAARLAVCGRGCLRTPLYVCAAHFDMAAVKMLSLTGGRAACLTEGENANPPLRS